MLEKRGNKRGQIAIFVIIAIVVVGVLLVIFLVPGANMFVTQDLNPSSFLSKCIEPEVVSIVSVLSKQGGYANPESFVEYQGERIQYLCYTSNNYELCRVQQPLLVQHVEEEIKSFVEPKARECVRNLEEEYEKRGFTVRTTPGEVEVEIVPNSINVEFLSPMTISKEAESAQTFSRFNIGMRSEWYDLLITAVSIIDFESSLGDSETILYIQYYPDLSMKKIKRGGDTIYKLSNVVTKEEFTFASRSLVWPPGYGLEDA